MTTQTQISCFYLLTYGSTTQSATQPEVALYWESVTSGLGCRHIYFRYNADSGNIVDNSIEQVDLENVGVAVDILSVGVLELEITLGEFYPPPISILCT